MEVWGWLMPLKLRLGSGIDKDRPDYTVYCGEWDLGRIYQTCGRPDNLRWKRRGWEDDIPPVGWMADLGSALGSALRNARCFLTRSALRGAVSAMPFSASWGMRGT